MNIENIKKAKEEALRFVERVDELLREKTKYDSGDKKYWFNAPKQSGAVRRASLDLTRALAEMRKP